MEEFKFTIEDNSTHKLQLDKIFLYRQINKNTYYIKYLLKSNIQFITILN